MICIHQFWVLNLWTWFERNICDAGWFISGEDRCCIQTVDQANVIDLELLVVVNRLLLFCSESLCLFHSATGCISLDVPPLSFVPIFIPPYQGMFEDKINDPAVREYFEVADIFQRPEGISKNLTARPWAWMFGMHGPSSSCWMRMVVVQWRLRHEGFENLDNEGGSIGLSWKPRATGVLPGLFALPGSRSLHGCRKAPSGGKWSFSRKNTKYQWKLLSVVLCFHLDSIFQVCDWEFSPERSHFHEMSCKWLALQFVVHGFGFGVEKKWTPKL